MLPVADTARCGTMPRAYSCLKGCSARPTPMPDGGFVPVRLVGEQHLREDLGSIPPFADCARLTTPPTWVLRGHRLDGPTPVDSDERAAGGALSAKALTLSGRAVRIEI